MHNSTHIISAVLSAALLLAGPVRASDVLPTLAFDDEPEAPSTAPESPAEPPAEQTSPAATPLEDAEGDTTEVADAKAKGVAYLTQLATNDASGFFAPPVRSRIVVGWEEKTLRYSKKVVDVPVYETVEVFRDVKVGDSVNAARIRKKVKVQKRVGTKKEEHHVRDRNGDIEKTTKVPKYGAGGPDEWRAFLFGQNAMAIYALIKAGMDPADPIVRNPADELLNLYEQYGLPDLTWDLAWSIAAFSEIDQPIYQDMARNMADKLLDGQIADGPAAGLWGPVCVNTSLLAAMLKKQNDYSKFYLAAKAKYDEKKRSSHEGRMQAALDALRTFAKLFKRVSMLGSAAYEDRIVLTLRDDDGIATPITVPGHPSYLVNQTAADMESTAIAMFGLRVAIEKKLLPQRTWRPNDDKGAPLAPPKTAAAVLQNAIAAIVDQQRQGAWSELNIHQPVKDFDGMKDLPGVPADPASFKPLASPFTETSTAQGYSVFTCCEKAYGMRGLGKFARSIIAGNAVVKSALDAGFKTVRGGQVAPYDFCFFLSEVPDLGNPEYDLRARERITEFLIEDQNKDGSWGGKPNRLNFLPSSLRERIASLPARHGIPAGAPPFKLADAHVPFGEHAEKKHLTIRRFHSFNPKVVATAYALLSLVEPPAATDE